MVCEGGVWWRIGYVSGRRGGVIEKRVCGGDNCVV